MNSVVEKFNKINSNIKNIKPRKRVNIIAVSKTFPLDHIKPLIDFGHCHFGENKVQEALTKWKLVKKEKPNLKLHMIGKLQSNKAKNAFELFDYIHSLDNQKLADIFSDCESKYERKIKYFLQVNIGNEAQKSGIPISNLEEFYNYCTVEKNLNVIGLMIIPPINKDTKKYFQSINELNKSLGLKDLSMGMSSDYEVAAKHKSTYLRIGSGILGPRV